MNNTKNIKTYNYLPKEIITKWMDQIINRYNSGISNLFALTGNIDDYGLYNYSVVEYVTLVLKEELKFDNIYEYDLANGLAPIDIDVDYGNHELDFKSIAYDENSKNIIFINYPELIFGLNNYNIQENQKIKLINIHKILTNTKFINSKNMVFFITDSTSNIHPMLLSNNNLTEINIELPNFEERLVFIEYLMEKTFDFDVVIDDDINNKVFSNLTAGLSYKLIEDIVLLANFNKNLNKKMIIERKKELIEKEHGEIIEIMETEGQSLDNFAGQEVIKNYFKDVVIDAVQNDNINIVPKGVLLMGPPGTGKTYFTQCLAGDAGMNSVEFQMSKIKDKWVGQSEKNLEKAFSVFRALAPVIVFIDEIEQALQRGGDTDHSVDRGIFGMFLAEMSKSENRGKIIWVGATNYPNKLDEALKRAGRFDKKIPFFAPEKEERMEVFNIHLKKSALQYKGNTDELLNFVGNETDGYTQAELENIIVKALELAMRKQKQYLEFEDIELALNYMLASNNDRITEMEDIALLECNDQEFIPKKYLERHRNIFNK